MSFPTNPADSSDPHGNQPSEESRRPFIEDVQVRLVGTTVDVHNTLDVLRQVFAVSALSDLERARGRHVRLYATINRRVPYSGGFK